MHIYVPLSSIVIEDRQRKERSKESLTALVNDIAENGLYHALQVIEDVEGPSYKLLTGAGRLEALQQLHALGTQVVYGQNTVPANTAPVVVRSDPGELGCMLIEYGENEHRAALTWQERDAVLRKIRALREKTRGPEPARAVAEAIIQESGAPVLPDSLVVDLSEAKFLEGFMNDPDVANAPHKKAALKIARRKAEKMFAEALGKITSTEGSGDELLVGDYREVLAEVEDRFVCVIADPPYGVGAHKFIPNEQHLSRHDYEDGEPDAEEALQGFSELMTRVTKAQAHIYVFCDIDQFHNLRTAFQDQGWRTQRTPLIWEKQGQGILPDATRFYRRVYECILYATKGDKTLKEVKNDVISFSSLIPDRIHAAQKPVELYKFLLSNSCTPGVEVLDPFCGSGTIFLAAQDLQLRAVGCELNEKTANIAKGYVHGKKK